MRRVILKGDWDTKEVFLNGKLLDPKLSQKVYNHSPDGFNWGYNGSGPAQLALAVCIELEDILDDALDNYQVFKVEHIATLPQDNFVEIINV